MTLAIGFGIVSASMLALGAVGFTLQFAVADLFNLAFGQVLTASAFVGYEVWSVLHTNLIVALLSGAAAGAAVSVLLNVVLFQPFRRRRSSRFTMVMVTLAVSQILVNVLQILTGVDPYNYPPPNNQSLRVLGMIFTGRQLAVIALAVLAVAALQLYFQGTRGGKAIRATASNGELASICGISTRRVINMTWLISGAFCGAAGVAFASNAASFDYAFGSDFFFLIVASAVFGGVGKPSAAVVGALIVGIVSELAAVIAPVLREVVALLALVVVLLLRPAGMFSGRRPATEQLSA
ncbi:MAG: branched-chain amino acid ABC transporter permease [Pseudomonadota bacterium]|nr:branched-chain amino acid ABC transporter permease [Pseudomonadota bacterium]